jgi:hypothetical protein
MAESFDPSSFIDALNRLTEATEEAALAEMGYVDRARNTLKTRVEIENQINKELLATYGPREFYESRSKTLFKKSLGDLGYIVDETGKIAKAINSPEMTGAQKRQIARLTELDRKQKETVEAQVFFGRNLKQGAADFGKTMASFGAELARGNTSFTTLNPIIDTVANTLSNLAKAVPFVGDTAGALVKATAEGSKLILELAEKNLKTFQDLSSVGATVVNGMTGLQTQILDSGMTQDGFTKTIKENAAILGRYGGTVGEGADKFSKAVGMLTMDKGPLKEAGMELRKLGLTADSIGERAAAYLEQEMLLGKGRSMTEEQLARGTVAYTKELTALQKVTGRSREDIENERKKILNRSRFSATMSDMQAQGFGGGAKAALSMMTSLPEDMKAGFEELLSGVMGPESAKLVQTFGSGIIDLVNSFKTAKTDMEGGAAFDAFNVGMKDLAKGSVEMTRQISMITNETGFTSFATQLKFATNEMPSFVEALQKVDVEGKNKDKLTTTTIKAQQNMEKLSQEMFKLGNDVMPLVTTATEKFTGALVYAVTKIRELFGKDASSSSAAAPNQPNLMGGSSAQDIMRNRERQSSSSSAPSSPSSSDSAASSRPSGVPKLKAGAEKRGNSTDALYAAVNQVHNMLGDDYKYFSGLNDRSSKESKHSAGKAFDLVLKDSAQYPAVLSKIQALSGITFAQFEKEGQVNKNGSKSTGDHIHAEVSAKYGGIASGPQTGFPAMLHGPKEAIIPLATDSILEKMANTPASAFANSAAGNTSDSMLISMLVDKFDAMINLLSNGNDIQDQLLRHSRI